MLYQFVHRMKRLILILLACFVAFSSKAQDDKKLDRFLTAAKRIGERFNENNYNPIITELFDDNLKRALPITTLQPLLDDIRRELGAITRMGSSQIISTDVAVIPVEFERGILDLQIGLDKYGKLTGIVFKEHAPPLVTPAMNGTALSLPCDGEWYVMWGGDTKEKNYHVSVQNQKAAIDMCKLGPDGRRFRTDGKINEDYYSFGQSVSAPADGTVKEAIDGVRDNTPGSLNQYSAVGNCVIIQHSDSEYSVFSHLKRGSVKVKAGDKVKKGDVIALCGNSGNSGEPHLHYHLQNSPILQIATGIKVYFDDIKLKNHPDGKLMPDKYSPEQGDIIYTPDL
jgi:hypothetical protein